MAFSWVDKKDGVDDILAEDINAIAREVVALSENAGGGGGFKKIGFTEDCDFIATTEEGLTAFRSAVEAASDGETFYVMPGTYVSTETLTIAKNLNFVGIGMPTIEFPIYIYGEGKYDVGGSSIITPIVTYSTNWSGIAFENQVRAFFTQTYASPLAFSSVNSVYCSFNGIGNRFMGSHSKSSFMFDFEEDYWIATLGGEFDCLGSIFENCNLIFKTVFSGLISAKKCNVFFNLKDTAGSGECAYIFEHCNIYNYGNAMLTNGQYASTFIVSNCNIFGSTFYSTATASGNYLFSGTAL